MTKPTHAERKRQQRARLAAGQVHRVAVYLTDAEADMVKTIKEHFDLDESVSPLVCAVILCYERLVYTGAIIPHNPNL